MASRVVPWEFGVAWDPNDDGAVLLSDERGGTVLALEAHPNDGDDRCVVLQWDGVRWASSFGLNDEARSGHPLWDRGLRDVLWGGVVRDSPLITELERRNSVHEGHSASLFVGLEHWVVLTKESTTEVVGVSITVRRVAGSPLDAAAAAFER